jgi:hypothetical protein
MGKIALGLSMLAACTAPRPWSTIAPVEPTAARESTPTLPHLPSTEHIDGSQTPGPSGLNILTPVPTLSSEDAKTVVRELLETNGGCRLPCWWGLTPGRTTWEEALRFLAPIAVSLAASEAPALHDHVLVAARFPVGEDLGDEAILIRFLVSDGVIRVIWASPQRAAGYQVQSALQTYGAPANLLVRTISRPEGVEVPFFLVLEHGPDGFMIVYLQRVEASGDTIRSCYREAVRTEVFAWSPEADLRLRDVAGLGLSSILPEDEAEEFREVMDIAGSDEFEWLYALSRTEGERCIRVPSAIWP